MNKNQKIELLNLNNKVGEKLKELNKRYSNLEIELKTSKKEIDFLIDLYEYQQKKFESLKWIEF